MFGEDDMTDIKGSRAERDLKRDASIKSDNDLIIQSSDLLPGDVLLYRTEGKKLHQRKISEATDSPYTHAAIYIGGGLVAESNVPDGVAKRPVQESMEGCQCVAVLRSQCGFIGDRPRKLREFVDSVLGQGNSYNLFAVAAFKTTSKKHFDNQLEIIATNYGKVTSKEQFAQQSFFCSAFVVACYSVVEIIGPTAQVAYPPNAFSPASLYRDPTFGWLLGYLVPPDGFVPENDPVQTTAHLWRNSQSVRWW